jgi:hypothetical protein
VIRRFLRRLVDEFLEQEDEAHFQQEDNQQQRWKAETLRQRRLPLLFLQRSELGREPGRTEYLLRRRQVV